MKILHQQVIVITGASSGVGRAIANELAETGATLVLGARRRRALEEVAEECRESGATVHVKELDVREEMEMQEMASFAAGISGTIDVWINNAGVLAAGSLEHVPAEVNENVIRTNLVGYMNGARAVLPYFKKQRHGILINNISVGGWLPTPFAAAYTASKFGIRGFSEALKGELAHEPDIHVVDLYPAFLDTPGIQHAANYTGRHLKPAPPVYDPRKVARAVVKVIGKPRSRKIVGTTALLLKLAYNIFPRPTRSVTAMVIRKYLSGASSTGRHPGNVLAPLDYGTSIDGGWRKQSAPARVAGALAIVAAVATGIFVYKSRKQG